MWAHDGPVCLNGVRGRRDAHNGPFIEHRNGRSWRLVNTPSGVADLSGVTALSDGTVVIVSSSGAILEN
jgi:hypothetical protein